MMLAKAEKGTFAVEEALPSGPTEALLSLITSADTIVISSTLAGSFTGTIPTPQIVVNERLIPSTAEAIIVPPVSSSEHAITPDS